MDDPLKLYKSKRDFATTPEPAEGGDVRADELSFVIQKHWARNLHYDFRLELDGTMKSWAVPKGPSLDNTVKRMAIHVEDHPISYSSFEGQIPAKQYGAGKVIIWDKGTWLPLGDPHKGYRDGNLKFELRGHKLRGKWVLVRMKSKGEKQEPWLLIKEKDRHARAQAEFSVIDEQPKSVRKLKMPKAEKTQPAVGPKPSKLPHTLAPQLATLVEGPPPDPQNWIYEIKFDGYRLLTRIDGRNIRLFTRNGNDWSSRLASLKQEIAALKLPSGWYDGEIVVPNEQGIPDFGALQQAFDNSSTKEVVLYLFDLPFFDGNDLRSVALESRRMLLQKLLGRINSNHVRFSEVFEASLKSVVESACKLGIEGVIAKRRDSVYVSRRSPDWIKLKCTQRQEFVIGGYTDPQGNRSGFGSLLLGVHDDHGALKYAGRVGAGFNERTLRNVSAQLKPLSSKSNPFSSSNGIQGRPHWVKPLLIAEVSFGEWTRAGVIRHPVFHGMRTDKKPGAIVREKPAKVSPPKQVEHAAAESHALPSQLRITNPNRVIDSSTGITKIELIRYYGLVGELMMEHLKDRPVALVRAPAGIGKELFFQKHAELQKLPGIIQLDPKLDPGHAPMLVVASPRGLLSGAQWNVVELHTRNGLRQSFATPDRMVFDLDPGGGVRWKQVVEAAELMRALLQQLALPAFIKTSGGKGLHLITPLKRVHDWDTVKEFSRALVVHMAKTIPQRFVAKSGPKNRVGRIFIDYLRNGSSATTASAWSARARPGLGISVPIEWDELKSLRSADQWTVRTAHKRLDVGNKPWNGYAKAACKLGNAIKLLKAAE